MDEYPKWVNGWIVPDAETEQAVLDDQMNFPTLIADAQHSAKPILPSVRSGAGQLLVKSEAVEPKSKRSPRRG